jgi:hypothetical protein
MKQRCRAESTLSIQHDAFDKGWRSFLISVLSGSAVTIGDSSIQSWERAIEHVPGPIGSLARQAPLFLVRGDSHAGSIRFGLRTAEPAGDR